MKCRVLKSKECKITQPFHYAGAKGYKYYHGGIDLVDFSHGYGALDWITAHTEGTVIGVCNLYYGQKLDGSYGNYVMLKHPNGYQTVYAHLAHNTLKVSLGEKVKKGQILGYMDNSGQSFGGHLHFEVRDKTNTKIDPEPYLNNDLPGMRKVTFRAHDLKKKEWLPKVKNGPAGVATAGKPGHKMGAFTIKSPKMKGYCAERRGRKGFGNYITTYGVHRGEYAGNKKRAILRIAIDAEDVAYKGQYTDGTWTPTRYGKNYSLTDPKGYIGDGKRPLAQVMCWIV